MIQTTKVFKNGNSQAVRIPSNLAYDRMDLEVEIEKIGPFGIGNPIPVVQVMNVKVSDVRAMGKEGSHLSLKIGDERIRCIWWGHGNLVNKIASGSRIHLVGKIKVNEFRGRRTAELDIIDLSLQ